MTKLKVSKKGYTAPPTHHQRIDPDAYIQEGQWFTELVLLCRPATQEDFNKHIGINSNYISKSILIDSLKFHYAVLSGALQDLDPIFNLTDNQKKAVISKINEEIGACTPGFHSRVNSLIECYFLPKTMDELLKSIRVNIVERTANQATNEVHANNRFFIMAEQLGLGVQPKLLNDPYCGAIPDQEICTQLKQAFDKHYQPFSILLQLKEMLITPFDQYVGRKEEGYLVATYGPGLEYLKNLFDETELNYDYLMTNEDTGVVYDINWDLILGKIWVICVQNKYFEYATWSSFFKDYHLNFISQFLKSDKEEKTEAAMSTARQLFFNPTDTYSREALENIPYLFTSAAECFAYFYCNPNLPTKIKTTLFHHALEVMGHECLVDLDDSFWPFIVENLSFSDVFISIYAEKYPQKLPDFEYELCQIPMYFHRLIQTSSVQHLKILCVKLKYLTTPAIEHIFLETNNNAENGLMGLVKKSKGHPEIMLSFIQYLSHLKPAALQHLLVQQNYNGENVLNVILSQGKEFSDVARQMINLIATLPLPRDQNILKLHDQRLKRNALLVAIKHCPSVVPAIFNMMLMLDEETQNMIVKNCLYHQGVLHKSCFIYLLKLNQKVNAMGREPSKKWVYQATKKLQNELISSLDVYFINHHQSNALTTLTNTWHEVINRTSVELDQFNDWQTILLNLTLMLVSIPLLGIPIAIHYYCSGYKHVFFRPSVLEELDHLDSSIQNTTFCLAG